MNKISITKFLFYGLTKLFYTIIKLILIPIGRNRFNKYIKDVMIDPYGNWLFRLFLSNNVYMFDPYEFNVRYFIRQKLSKGGVFLDLGSATGNFIPYVKHLVGNGGMVIAVEPDPRNIKYLIELQKKIDFILIEFAIFNKFTETKLNVDPTGFSYVSQLKILKERNKGSISNIDYDVSTIRLDYIFDIISINNNVIDIIKFDIEGAEYDVLTDPSLDLNCVKNIVLELHYPIPSKEYSDILISMIRKGFTLTNTTLHTLMYQKCYSHHLFFERFIK